MPPASRTHLIHRVLKIHPHGRLLVFPTLISQPAAHVAHLLQRIPSNQQILDVLRHDPRHIFQIVVQFIQVRRSTRILILLRSPLHKGIELHKRIWTQSRCHGFVLIGVCEFRGDVLQVREGEFAGIRAFANAQIADVFLDHVAELCVPAI